MSGTINQLAWTANNLLNAATTSVADALAKSGLDWTVEKVPCFISGPKGGNTRLSVPGRFGVRRVDNGQPLGVVGSTWHPYQNSDGFAIVDDVIGETGFDVAIKGAGQIGGGKKVWVLAEVNEKMFIAGEEYGNYLLFTNGHDGRSSVACGLINVRLFCNNQQNFVLSGAASERIIRVRHTVKAKERIAEAAKILRLRNKRNEELAQQGEWLVSNEMPDDEFDKFLTSLMPINDEPESPAATMVGARRDAVSAIYHQAANLEQIRGTRWGALQAVIEYSDHGRKFKDAETQMKAQFGMTSTALQQRAYDILTAA